MTTKEQKINELLNDLNNYLDYRSKLRWGGEWIYYFIYENGNYYVVNKPFEEKVVISDADLCNYLIEIDESKIASIIYGRIDKINKEYEN